VIRTGRAESLRIDQVPGSRTKRVSTTPLGSTAHSPKAACTDAATLMRNPATARTYRSQAVWSCSAQARGAGAGSIPVVPVEGARDGKQRHVVPRRLTRQICRSRASAICAPDRTGGGRPQRAIGANGSGAGGRDPDTSGPVRASVPAGMVRPPFGPSRDSAKGIGWSRDLLEQWGVAGSISRPCTRPSGTGWPDRCL
jgi:hypothetical protein